MGEDDSGKFRLERVNPCAAELFASICYSFEGGIVNFSGILFGLKLSWNRIITHCPSRISVRRAPETW